MRRSGIAGSGAFVRWLRGPALTAALLAPGVAWAATFKSVPKAEEAAADEPDTILGLIHINTAFFIAVGVIAVFWFLFGGGRKAKIGRNE